jgi:hypothetical protein
MAIFGLLFDDEETESMAVAPRVLARATQPVRRRGDDRSRRTPSHARTAFVEHGTEPITARCRACYRGRPPCRASGVAADQRQQVSALPPAQRLHGQVHLACLNLQRRILGQRRLHFLRHVVVTW